MRSNDEEVVKRKTVSLKNRLPSAEDDEGRTAGALGQQLRGGVESGTGAERSRDGVGDEDLLCGTGGVGAGDGGVVRELTRYQSPKCIDLVEIDELVIEVCRKYLPKTACRLDDPRVHIHIADGLKFNESAHLEASSRATAAGATGGHSSAASGHTASHIAAGHTAHHHIRAGGCCPQIGNGVPLL